MRYVSCLCNLDLSASGEHTNYHQIHIELCNRFPVHQMGKM